jgi:hypothetical protein
VPASPPPFDGSTASLYRHRGWADGVHLALEEAAGRATGADVRAAMHRGLPGYLAA